MNNTIFEKITLAREIPRNDGDTIGYSRKGRAIKAFKLGAGPLPVSLIGGLYADEPVGPRFLRQLTSFLTSLPSDHILLRQYQWWIIPHANPDGEHMNRPWTDMGNGFYPLSHFLTLSVQEQLDDDMEFGFPQDEQDKTARPENKAIYRWWESSTIPFALHLSLHGMTFGQGPLYMIDPAWISKSRPLIDACTVITHALGYGLQNQTTRLYRDVIPLCEGFTTRPDSRALKAFYTDHDAPDIAANLRPNSMEIMRKLSGDCLTLMTLMPLFIVPEKLHSGNGHTASSINWEEQFNVWRRDGNRQRIDSQAFELEVKPMDVKDQMLLIFEFLRSGIKLAEDVFYKE